MLSPIYARYTRQELSRLTGGIFIILTAIVLVFMTFRVLDYANQGIIHSRHIALMLLLSLLNYLPHLLMASVFLACVMVFQRWHQDSEWLIWQSSGLSLWHFLWPLWQYVALFFVVVMAINIWVWPWSNAQIAQFKDYVKQKDQVSLLLEGKFFDVGNDQQRKTLFIEDIDAKTQKLRSVFVSNAAPLHDGLDIIRADKATIMTQYQHQFALLEQGARYQIQNHADKDNIQTITFQRLLMPIYGMQSQAPSVRAMRSTPTRDLWKNATPDAQSELSWRLSMPMTLWVLPMLALALGIGNHRRPRYLPLVLAMVAYFTYMNGLNLMQAWVGRGKLAMLPSVYVLHGCVIVLTILMLYLRTHGVWAWKRWRNSLK